MIAMPSEKTRRAWRSVCGSALLRTAEAGPAAESFVPVMIGARRSNFNVARRSAAAKAIRAALPHLTLQEIGDLLKVSHQTVISYLADDVKAACRPTPAWAKSFSALAVALATQGNDVARAAAVKLAAELSAP